MTSIREATPDDVAEIVELIVELAVYEREPDAVKLTPARLHDQLFGEHPAIYAHVADAPEGSGRLIDGFALWFLNYSTWEGQHGIYLEDLYVRQDARGLGLGKALLLNLAHIANERGFKRVEWSVLQWNTPSIDFYRSLGAVAMDGWDTMRLTGAALEKFGTP